MHLILSTFRIKSSGHEKEFTTELKPKIYTINVDIEVPGLYDQTKIVNTALTLVAKLH